MTVGLAVVRTQQIQIGLLMLVGFVGVKIGLLKKETVDALAAYVLRIATPCMLIYKLPIVSTRAMLLSAIPVFLFAFAAYGLLLLAGYLSGRLCRYSGNRLRIHTVQVGIGNLAALGFPMMTALLGDEASIYLAAIFLVDQIYLNGIGYPLSFPAGQKTKFNLSFLKRILSPMMIALILAIVMILLDLRLTEGTAVAAALSSITASSQPVAMIFVGGIIGGMKLEKNAGISGALTTVLVRMIAMPFVIFWLSGLLCFPLMAREVVTMNAALPPLMSMVIMSKANGSDYNYATVNVCITTICFLVTLPIVVQMTTLLY